MANDFVTRNGFISLDSSQITGSLFISGGISGSLFGTSSWAINAVSASFAENSRASFALTASSADQFNVRQNATASSLFVTGSTILSGSVQSTGSVIFSCIYLPTWYAGGVMIVARNSGAGIGTQNAGLVAGGATAIAPCTCITTRCTEEYDGVSWTVGGAMLGSSAFGTTVGPHQSARAGTQNAGLSAGGYFYLAVPGCAAAQSTNCVQAYDGNAWANRAVLITARGRPSGAGSQNQALVFGGLGPGFVAVTCTEEYNGTSWSTGGALITARQILAGAGTQNEGLAFGGTPSGGCTEEYNGTSWSAGGAMNSGRSGLGGGGTQNVALGFGSPTCTEAYNGTVWVTGNSMGGARSGVSGDAGTANNAFAAGGVGATYCACTEEYNDAIIGSSLFSYSGTTGQISATGSLFGTSSLSITSSFAISSSFATSASFLISPSASIATTASFIINPTSSLSVTSSFSSTSSFSITSSLSLTASAVNVLSQSLAISGSLGVFVGNSSRLRVETIGVTLGGGSAEVVAVSGSMVNTGSLQVTGSVLFSYVVPGVGQAVWTSGGSMITNRSALAGAGTQNEGLASGGTPATTSTEEYNGTTWSTGGALNAARWCLAGAGTQNAGLSFGGRQPAYTQGWTNALRCTEEYNGTTWATSNLMITGRTKLGSAGTQNEGLAFAGSTVTSPGPEAGSTLTEEYDGTSWAAGGTLICGLTANAGAGTQNAALNLGGQQSPFGFIRSCTQIYNGTTWASGNAMVCAKCFASAAGVQNSAASLGGSAGTTYAQSVSACAEFYNGTSWSLGSPMTIARLQFAAAGNVNTCLLAFGNPTATEEFSPGPSPVVTFEHRGSNGMLLLSTVSSSLNYIDDAAAASAGVPLGGLYRSGSLIRIRLV